MNTPKDPTITTEVIIQGNATYIGEPLENLEEHNKELVEKMMGPGKKSANSIYEEIKERISRENYEHEMKTGTETLLIQSEVDIEFINTILSLEAKYSFHEIIDVLANNIEYTADGYAFEILWKAIGSEKEVSLALEYLELCWNEDNCGDWSRHLKYLYQVLGNSKENEMILDTYTKRLRSAMIHMNTETWDAQADLCNLEEIIDELYGITIQMPENNNYIDNLQDIYIESLIEEGSIIKTIDEITQEYLEVGDYTQEEIDELKKQAHNTQSITKILSSRDLCNNYPEIWAESLIEGNKVITIIESKIKGQLSEYNLPKEVEIYVREAYLLNIISATIKLESS